jgi:two-component system sensor histidine kinase SenX3
VDALAVGLGSAALAALVAWLLARRRADAPVRALESDLAIARSELREVRRSSGEDREVRGLILSSMEEGVLMLEPTGDVAFANDAVGEHLGARPANLSQLLPLGLREAAAEAAAASTVVRREVEVGTPTRWLRATATPIGEDGTVLLVVRDVTEARRLDAVRRDFVTNASHELKTPAASIQAAAETLRSASVDDPEAVPRFSRQLEREAVRLSRIVADLLDLSRLESGSALDERVRLDAIVREESRRFMEAAEAAGIDLTVAADRSPAVRGSARDLSLLVRNLIDNAIRYTKRGGSVTVSVAVRDGDVALRVSDTGAGIPTRDLSRIFERFYRVDRARSRETGGTGLGLSIVKHVSENHGGSVSVESELGRGTTFDVRLPRADPA